jgi:hypothetical protein
MDKMRITGSGRAVIIAAAVFVAATVVLIWFGAPQETKAQQAMPSVAIQWQPQTLLETRFAAKITEDNLFLLGKLKALAGEGEVMPAQSMSSWKEGFGKTYLSKPRLWVAGKWVEGLDKVLEALRPLVRGSRRISIDAVSAIIEYKETAGRENDIDAIARVRVTFSASPEGMILEGTLCHSRPCPIIPCDR